MSLLLISRSPDLEELHLAGYAIEVQCGFLLVRDVPYLDSTGSVRNGTLCCALELAGERTAQPTDHTMLFEGEIPHRSDGGPLTILAGSGRQNPVQGVWADHHFSRKPTDNGHRYRDYFHKVTTYVSILESEAQAVDPHVTARSNIPVPVLEGEQSVFVYSDTASSRAGIERTAARLAVGPVAIIGLGGSGGYVLDLVAKTPVTEVHLFDGDRFIQHNAFRAPGAPALDDLEQIPSKVDYFSRIYSRMHNGVRSHPYRIDTDNVTELATMSFVFVAVDDGEARRQICSGLEQLGVSFIDVGMGVYEVNQILGGQVRITASTLNNRESAHARLPFGSRDPNNDYMSNIQIADLNCLAATLAVIRWKKLVGFYQDTENEMNTVYSVGGNCLINEDYL
ncbi:ThiF family adenylyltransferase [Williamsia maris]|uniref:ThiF family protein n=1 Tax=Williamsia maris TaxID=72806 RepID=A0ABT1HDA5_9NOCA|nr:ThiF family adenylyltransferase [Williamsia maris]MCP2175907.1 ThiF family protein [Williamsia maris]